MVLLMALQENYRKSFIRNNRVKKISGEPVAVIKRATSGSRAIGSYWAPFVKILYLTDLAQKLLSLAEIAISACSKFYI